MYTSLEQVSTRQGSLTSMFKYSSSSELGSQLLTEGLTAPVISYG